MDQQTIEKGKQFAFVSYLTLIGTLIAFFMNKDKPNPFTSFHIRQALGLWLLQMATGYLIGGFNNWNITAAYWVFFIVLFAYGILGALTGRLNIVPIIGDFFQKLFKSIR